MPSEAYNRRLKEATAHHASSKTYSGSFLRPHKPFLSELISRLNVTSLLDYGCGKGEQYRWIDPNDGCTLEQAWGFEVTKFDPAWPPYSTEPAGQFDLVICTHVLGGIPIVDQSWVVERLFAHARKAVFIGEKIGKIKKRVHGDRDGMLDAVSAIEWIDLIIPHRRPGIETHLSVTYRSDQGKFLGRFQL